MRHDQPGGATDGHGRARVGIYDALGDRGGRSEILHLIQVVGSRAQDGGRMLVLRVSVGKPE